MFTTILLFIGGAFIGAGITMLYHRSSTRTFKKDLIKSLWDERGTSKFGMITAINTYGAIIGTIEIEELQSAGDRTKVKVIKVYVNNDKKKEDVMASIACDTSSTESWIYTNTIKWYNNANQYMRDKRLDDILEKPNV